MRAVLVSLVALSACNGGKDGLEPVDTSETPGTTVSTPDLWEGMGPDPACEDYDGTPVAGATSWFLGEYDLDVATGEATGTEYWVLYANDAWVATGASDCQIVWTVYANITETGACATCDFGLYAEGIPDLETSDCPEDLEAIEAVAWDAVYDVRVEADGTATFYFGDTGTLIGEGYGTPTYASWRRDKACVWF